MISSKNIDKLADLAIKLSDKGGIALMAIACCGYLIWDVGELRKIVVKQGQDDVKSEEQTKQLRREVDDIWKLRDDGQNEKIIYVSKIILMEEQIKELQRKH